MDPFIVQDFLVAVVLYNKNHAKLPEKSNIYWFLLIISIPTLLACGKKCMINKNKLTVFAHE